MLLKDVIDHLLDRGRLVSSLDEAGDTLDNMVKQREYIGELQRTGASILLLSAGGNDVLGGSNLAHHLRDEDETLPPSDLLLPSFFAVLDHTLGLYERIVREVEALPGNVITICHGYDRPLPNEGRWLGQPMGKRKITDPARQRQVVSHMIDVFNGRLQQLAQRFPESMVYLDVRGRVGSALAEWHDELHPKDPGYGRVADLFDEAIEQALGKGAQPAAPVVRSRGAVDGAAPLPARVGRRGVSLHVGLNRIDPNHYGTDGALAACVFDAEDMELIASDRGFERRTLLVDEQATRQAVKDAIAQAAEELRPGDLFFLSYAGHGSQVPDLNGDEGPDDEQRQDETLCLYDGMLLDDELFELWAGFRSDVRVLMISDSCHSGTQLRGPQDEPTDRLPGEPARRLLPKEWAAHAYRRHRAFYEALGRQVRGGEERLPTMEIARPMRCSALLISGCQDHQTSRDGTVNGRFTQELLQVWNNARFRGNYRELHQRVVAGMPNDQKPNLMLIGPATSTFVAQVPFAI
ncbi:MAG: caspase family protein [Limnobacter sp.]|nr:caspase family protein [Limnobacter sp.]